MFYTHAPWYHATGLHGVAMDRSLQAVYHPPHGKEEYKDGRRKHVTEL